MSQWCGPSPAFTSCGNTHRPLLFIPSRPSPGVGIRGACSGAAEGPSGVTWTEHTAQSLPVLVPWSAAATQTEGQVLCCCFRGRSFSSPHLAQGGKVDVGHLGSRGGSFGVCTQPPDHVGRPGPAPSWHLPEGAQPRGPSWSFQRSRARVCLDTGGSDGGCAEF